MTVTDFPVTCAIPPVAQTAAAGVNPDITPLTLNTNTGLEPGEIVDPEPGTPPRLLREAPSLLQPPPLVVKILLAHEFERHLGRACAALAVFKCPPREAFTTAAPNIAPLELKTLFEAAEQAAFFSAIFICDPTCSHDGMFSDQSRYLRYLEPSLNVPPGYPVALRQVIAPVLHRLRKVRDLSESATAVLIAERDARPLLLQPVDKLLAKSPFGQTEPIVALAHSHLAAVEEWQSLFVLPKDFVNRATLAKRDADILMCLEDGLELVTTLGDELGPNSRHAADILNFLRVFMDVYELYANTSVATDRSLAAWRIRVKGISARLDLDDGVWFEARRLGHTRANDFITELFVANPPQDSEIFQTAIWQDRLFKVKSDRDTRAAMCQILAQVVEGFHTYDKAEDALGSDMWYRYEGMQLACQATEFVNTHVKARKRRRVEDSVPADERRLKVTNSLYLTIAQANALFPMLQSNADRARNLLAFATAAEFVPNGHDLAALEKTSSRK
ncbi:hypothetical protein BKA62DRAFT_772506 [Auriculariales sp. MPI-PUGE-AT-0066]|nr:hypothetical protein BKA62DRAFT_772506 [Auriculariales sp. MPI-PUGE-AT-0066]